MVKYQKKPNTNQHINSIPQLTQKSKLIMRPLQQKCQKPLISLDFRPTRKHQLYNQYKNIPLFPVFNTDKKYYTPTFKLRTYTNTSIKMNNQKKLIKNTLFELNKNQDNENDQIMKQNHQKKLLQYTQDVNNNEILVPKPRSKHKYCAVCRDHYEDYYQHIHTRDHRQSLTKSRFNEYINQLCDKFNKNTHTIIIKKDINKLDNTNNNDEMQLKRENDEFEWYLANLHNNSIDSIKSVKSTRNEKKTTMIILSDD